MKRTPYTVPDGFFEKAEMRAVSAAARISKVRKFATGSACALAALALMISIWMPEKDVNINALACSAEYTDEEILDIYDYDIFLNTNF